MWRLAHIKNQAADALAGLMRLARNLLASRQESFGPPRVDDQRPALDSRHRAGHDRAFAIAEFLKDAAALRLANPLAHHLLGGLSGDSSHPGHGDRITVERRAGAAGQ